MLLLAVELSAVILAAWCVVGLFLLLYLAALSPLIMIAVVSVVLAALVFAIGVFAWVRGRQQQREELRRQTQLLRDLLEATASPFSTYRKQR